MTPNDTTPAPQGKKFLFLRLTPGIGTGHALTFYFSCLLAIMFASFMPQMQP